MEKTIYLDNASTTKVDLNVVKAMNEFFLEDYANYSSNNHFGKKIKNEVEKARKKIANHIEAEENEIIFTTGGTESNNLAIKGLAYANPKKKHIITSEIEHPSVLEVCKMLEKKGYSVDYVGVNKEGLVDVKEIKSKIREDTLVVSIMHVNNEIGTIQPIEEIGRICREKRVYFHTDAVQSFKKIDIDVSKTNIDLLSVSGHKINGPKGIGFLYVKNGIKIEPLIEGGGQENNLRSGTINSPGIIGLSSALDIEIDKNEVKNSRDELLLELLKIPGTRLNGSREKRIYNNINVSFFGIEGGDLVDELGKKGIYISTGSACSSSKLNESYVLKAIKADPLYIHGSIRLTIDKLTKKEIDFVAENLKESVKKLRELSPFKLELNKIEMKNGWDR